MTAQPLAPVIPSTGVTACRRPGSAPSRLTPSEIKQLVAYVRANAVPRRNSRGGHNAAENLISALRCLYNRAVDDGLIEEKDNPALKVDKPRRMPSTRRALTDKELADQPGRRHGRRP